MITGASKSRGGVLLWILFVILPLGAGAYFAFSSQLATQDDGPVLTHSITRGDLKVTITEQGTLESYNNAEIKCKVRGSSTIIQVIPNGTIVQPGDTLVELDTRKLETNHSLTLTNVNIAIATLETTKANLKNAEMAEDAYLKGSYLTTLKNKEKQLAIAQENLSTSKKMLDQSEKLFKQGYVTDLEVAGHESTVEQAQIELQVQEKEIEALEKYTKAKQLVEFKGRLLASQYKYKADVAGLEAEEARRDRAEEELKSCVVKSERSGLVIYPTAEAWRGTPDIAEGAGVRHDQVLLLMPDLTKMQVKVGVHESMVDRVKAGMPVKITLPDQSLDTQVSSVATVASPAGWWNGNAVEYDTIIKLPDAEGLKPGMSAEVEIVMAEYTDVLTIPVAAVVETEQGFFCWVKQTIGVQRRPLQLGDTNDIFIIVEAGLQEGDAVVLNPLAYIDEVQDEAMTPDNPITPSSVSSETSPQPSEGADDAR